MLNNITIKNFRAITELTLDNLGQINLLFGENNCGKSSILEAIFCLTSSRDSSLPLATKHFRKISKEENFNISHSDSIKHLFTNLDIEKTITISAKNEDDIKLNITADLTEYIEDENDEVFFSAPPDLMMINGVTIQYFINGEKKKPIKFKIINERKFNKEIQLIKYVPESVFINDNAIKNILENFKEIQENSQRVKQIVSLLKKIDNNITDLRLGKNNNILVNTGFTEPMPIEMMGDGIIKALTVAIAIFKKTDIVLIDEIENGLHHKSQDIVWKAIIEWTKEYNIQFFITTHSYEMIERLTRQIDEKDKEILKAFRIERKEEEFKVVDFNAEDLAYIIGERWEIR